MEEDGSFSLKNLGKNSIFINGKEVSTGQLIHLGSSSLIEVGLCVRLISLWAISISMLFNCPDFLLYWVLFGD